MTKKQPYPVGVPIQRISLVETGLQRFVGPLEASILYAVWEMKVCTLAEIHNYILVNDDNNLSYSTIATIVTRLYTKGLLIKQKQQHGSAPLYTVKYDDPTTFVTVCLTALFIELITDYGAAILTEALRRATRTVKGKSYE